MKSGRNRLRNLDNLLCKCCLLLGVFVSGFVVIAYRYNFVSVTNFDFFTIINKTNFVSFVISTAIN